MAQHEPRAPERNRDVLVCYAVKEELGPGAAGSGAEIRLTGMGPRNALQAIRAALEAKPYRLVLTCGFAGGLDPALETGTVLFSEDAEAGLGDRLVQCGARLGRFHCAQRVAATAAEKRVLRESTGADAVEMESSIIQAFCREKGVRSATVRVILDPAQEDLPLDFNALMTPQDRISYPKLAAAVLLNPRKIPALRRLQAQTALARQSLDRVLGGLLVRAG